ncbi:hypothetical protein FF80_02776 [Devosia sp. LC5]|nr:hypothetical protein FF80_02776 [Devosia sp. LC5]
MWWRTKPHCLILCRFFPVRSGFGSGVNADGADGAELCRFGTGGCAALAGCGSRHASCGPRVHSNHNVIPAKAGTSVFFSGIANGGPRFRGDDMVGGIDVSAALGSWIAFPPPPPVPRWDGQWGISSILALRPAGMGRRNLYGAENCVSPPFTFASRIAKISGFSWFGSRVEQESSVGGRNATAAGVSGGAGCRDPLPMVENKPGFSESRRFGSVSFPSCSRH